MSGAWNVLRAAHSSLWIRSNGTILSYRDYGCFSGLGSLGCDGWGFGAGAGFGGGWGCAEGFGAFDGSGFGAGVGFSGG
jgi:hypothetical protein